MWSFITWTQRHQPLLAHDREFQMLDIRHDVIHLHTLFHATKALSSTARLATRIKRISELQHLKIPRLRVIAADEAIALAQGNMPYSLELHRTSRAELVALWGYAYAKRFGKSDTEWLFEIEALFEWARSHCEEAGEIGFEFKFVPFFSTRRAKWLRAAPGGSQLTV